MSTESAISTAIDRILHAEGGFVNDAADPGGATNLGITLATFRQYVRPDGSVDDLRAMTTETARSVYREQYIHAPHIDQLPEALIPQVADIAVNSGAPQAVRMLQRVLGTDADGRIGPGTIASARAACQDAAGVARVSNALVDAREAFYHGLVANRPTSAKFLSGWLKRAESFRIPVA